MIKSKEKLVAQFLKPRYYPCDTDRCRDKRSGFCYGVCPELRVWWNIEHMEEPGMGKYNMAIREELIELGYLK